MRFTKILLTTLLTGSCAFALPTALEKFDMADLNKNGNLSQKEFYSDQARKMELKSKEGKSLKGAVTAPSFNNVDLNNDGKVTFQEYRKFHTKRQKDMINIRNKGLGNGSGNKMFNNYDRNRDGLIDKNEFRKLYKDLKQKGDRQGQKKGNGFGNQRGAM